MGNIRIGTCGWTDKTLIRSGWYPPAADTPEKRLAYYARQFPIVEVDSTYYGPPSEQTTKLWAARTPAGFTFNIKAFSLLTGHPTRVSALYKDLRPDTAKANVYPQDLPPQAYEEVWSRFLTALDPLAEAGKLGALLFQFPPWFGIRRSNKEFLLEVAARCRPLRPVFEFRNAAWFEGGNREETLGFLKDNNLAYVVVDMPQGHKSSVPPILTATADLAVVRFHGHSDKWTSKDIGEKFGYRYSDEELADWVPKLRALSGEAKNTHVLMNNCLSDYAQRNATTLLDLLDDAAVPAPAT
ncbi:hypothetical protein ACWT_5160 [Actinoplanes sp. SE50]|uniref:DUF72 domain-containing protein n=1 Tax=unclassified Actinoplanes TaxID=2626549 RepID=UPI00023ED4A2|nr:MULTISPECIES: DUF72 domain-containing protein [unclassified Actinoplanes]AEV86177.1 hypothetical protein ACPL_5290 [Actinoplanes sp. SE50/110]ATO84575.1 hypothetical protein ACWT_5160 [Actinoplanes sp. SE50]SLM01985.1 hypothetical protein ACSP50_5223 [Actinoplanes sp. SE50/110]